MCFQTDLQRSTMGDSDDQRCRRSDGRHWRCTGMAMDGSTLCKKHYLQAKDGSVKASLRRKNGGEESGENKSVKKKRFSDEEEEAIRSIGGLKGKRVKAFSEEHYLSNGNSGGESDRRKKRGAKRKMDSGEENVDVLMAEKKTSTSRKLEVLDSDGENGNGFWNSGKQGGDHEKSGCRENACLGVSGGEDSMTARVVTSAKEHIKDMDFLDSDVSSDSSMSDYDISVEKGVEDMSQFGQPMSIHFDAKKTSLLRYTCAMQTFKTIVEKTFEHEGAHQFLMDRLHVLSSEISAYLEPLAEPEVPSHVGARRNLLGDLFDDSVFPADKIVLLNPASVSAKGGSSTKRIFSGIEMATSKRRKYKLCNQSGHNRRSYSKSKEGDTQAESTATG